MFEVLFVDDEPDIRRMVGMYFEGDSEVLLTTAESIATAKEILKQRKFTVLIIDYGLQEQTGVEFMKCLRDKMNIWTPVIFFTGGDEKEIKKYLYNGHNCVAAIQKTNITNLVSEVKNIIYLHTDRGMKAFDKLKQTADEIHKTFDKGREQLSKLGGNDERKNSNINSPLRNQARRGT